MSGDNNLWVGAPTCIAATGDKCGEGILWDHETESVYWTDINRFLVHRFKVRSSELRTWFFPQPVTCVLATNRRDTFALVLGSGIALWEPEHDRRQELLFSLPGWPRVRCNDSGIDPLGALWVGSMMNNVKSNGEPGEASGQEGVLFRISQDGQHTEVRRDLGIANTILWSPDNSKFYFGDTLKNQIWICDYDMIDGSIRNERSFFQGYARGWPDGSAIDSEGCIWNCRYGGGCIVRISQDGNIDRVIEMPVSNVTNCTFGGSDGNTLFVTSASPDQGEWERFGGCLFAIETNVSGVPANQFHYF